jgi:hypothetical protein
MPCHPALAYPKESEMSVIGVDVAEVLALEEPAKALLEAIRKALPAIDRLEGYAGADWLGQQLGDATLTNAGFGTVAMVASALEMFSASAGDQGAFDYALYVADWGLSVQDAAQTIMDEGELDVAMPRIEAMRQYAATV